MNGMDARLFGDKNEQHLHKQAIEDISEYYKLPTDMVMRAYKQELLHLGVSVPVRCYLPILIRRRVKIVFNR